MCNELDVIILNKDYPKYGVKAGEVGTIVHKTNVTGVTMYMIEFCDESGQTTCLEFFTREDFEVIK